MDDYKKMKSLCDKVKTLDIQETVQDIQFIEASNYNISYKEVRISINRVLHYLRKYNHKQLANELEKVYINIQRRINLHTCLIALIKEIKETKEVESNILDYILEQYKGIAYEDPSIIFRITQTRAAHNNLKYTRKTLSETEHHTYRRLYYDDVTAFLRESELEVLLLSTLLFSSNRAYIGKIDKYLEKHDSVMLRERLKSILEADHDGHTIQFLDESNNIADKTFESFEDIEEQLRTIPEEIIDPSLLSEDEYQSIRLQELLDYEMFINNYKDEEEMIDEQDRLDNLSKYISHSSLSNLHTKINYGSNDALTISSSGIKEIDPVILTRYIRNSLAHHRWVFKDNAYVHMWHHDEKTGKLDFNIKIPVETLREYIKFLNEIIFNDVKYLTIDEMDGNYPNIYLDMEIPDIIKDLINKGVILKKDETEVLELAKQTLETKCAFYTDNYSKARAKLILKYILDNCKLLKDDRTFISDLIANDEMDYFIDKDLRGVLDWLADNNVELNFNELEQRIEKDSFFSDLNIDLHFQHMDKNIAVLREIRTKYIEPLIVDYTLIADYSKIISNLNNYDKGTSLDLIPVLPLDTRTKYINVEVLIKALLNTILTVLFVHTELDEKLTEQLDFSSMKLTRRGKKVFERDLEQKTLDIESAATTKLDLFTKNLKKSYDAAVTEGNRQRQRLRDGKPTKPAKLQFIKEKIEQFNRNKELIKEVKEELIQQRQMLIEARKTPISFYNSTTLYNKIRNSLAHGNIIIPDNLDLTNLDEVVITIVDKDHDDELSFEGTIKLVDLLREITKQEIMDSNYMINHRFDRLTSIKLVDQERSPKKK